MLQLQAQPLPPGQQMALTQRQSLNRQRLQLNAGQVTQAAFVSSEVRLQEAELIKSDLQEDLQSSVASVLHCAKLQEVHLAHCKQLTAMPLSGKAS